MTRIAIVGVAGRMGRTLVNAVQQDPEASLGGGIVSPAARWSVPTWASSPVWGAWA